MPTDTTQFQVMDDIDAEPPCTTIPKRLDIFCEATALLGSWVGCWNQDGTVRYRCA